MTPIPDPRAEERRRLREELRKSIEPMKGIYPVDRYEGEVKIGRLRRRGAKPFDDPTRSLTLLEDDDGVLFWEEGAVLARPVGGLRRGLRGTARSGEVVEHVIVEPLDPSQIGTTLTGFDRMLTPNPGLREFVGGKLKPPDPGLKPVKKGKILLIVHGTFSEAQAIFNQLADINNKEGNALLGRAGNQYQQILAFDHPTLAVSPILNAMDLARHFRDTEADVDVICHSRGGLVTRWWLEAFDRPVGKRRAILVGAPLDGTSLASPPHLRDLLSWFSNVNKFIGTVSSIIPFMTVVSCLARLTSTVTSVVAKTPIVDAAMAMVPGLAAMSRIGNNFELARLNTVRDTPLEYFAIKSHFQPSDPGWRFWEHFVDKPLLRAAHSLFPGETDLVVDTVSMTVLESSQTADQRTTTDLPLVRVYDFGATDTVFHTNYFSQPKTCEKIGEWLQI
jgi:hypothetical protein